MRAKWEPHDYVQELYIRFSDGQTSEWRIVGWVQQDPSDLTCRVYCHWIRAVEYPEGKVFETAKKARRALKAAATIAVVGGWRGTQNF